MTFATLAHIHNLLVNDEYKTKLKLEHERAELRDAEDLFVQKLITKAQLASAKDSYHQADEDHDQAYSALAEFNEHEWR